MPILTQQTDHFPSRLLEGLPDDAEGRRWWAVYTKSRQEKSLARQLLAHRIPFYLPMVSRQGNRKAISYLPVFPNYAFVYGDDEERQRVVTTNRTVSILPVHDQASFYADLSQLGRVIAAGEPLVVEDRLPKGQKVRVTEGALTGLEGIVLQQRNACRLLVAVHMLRQGVSLSIKDYMVEPIR